MLFKTILETKNIYDEVVIDENFILKSQISFIFDLKNMCYSLETNNNASKLLKDNLKKDAMNKIREYNEYLKSMKNKKDILDLSESNESNDDINSNSEEEHESSDSDEESISQN